MINELSESILHFYWKSKTLSQGHMSAYTGESIEILNFGIHNHHQGPDFLECRIKINGTLWVGSVEIHIKSSDWTKHNHSIDPKYDNVILHVVYEVDTIPNKLPCLELKNIFPNDFITKFKCLNTSNDPILCKPWVTKIPSIHWVYCLDTMLIERFSQKSEKVFEVLSDCNNDWLECIYRIFAKSFGLKINELAFYELACRLPYKTLLKHKDQLFQIEALLYGQSGLLFDPNVSIEEHDSMYLKALRDEYKFLASKYNLIHMNSVQWNFGRLRPPSFPTIRISHFASFLYQSNNLLDYILSFDYSQFKSIDISATTYWDTHYTFGPVTKEKVKKLGQDHLRLIVVNAVVPLLFTYGKWILNHAICEYALEILTKLPREISSILDNWQFLNKQIKTSYETQAIYHLTKNYCSKKQCLQCSIGHKVLNLDVL